MTDLYARFTNNPASSTFHWLYYSEWMHYTGCTVTSWQFLLKYQYQVKYSSHDTLQLTNKGCYQIYKFLPTNVGYWMLTADQYFPMFAKIASVSVWTTIFSLSTKIYIIFIVICEKVDPETVSLLKKWPVPQGLLVISGGLLHQFIMLGFHCIIYILLSTLNIVHQMYELYKEYKERTKNINNWF